MFVTCVTFLMRYNLSSKKILLFHNITDSKIYIPTIRQHTSGINIASGMLLNQNPFLEMACSNTWIFLMRGFYEVF